MDGVVVMCEDVNPTYGNKAMPIPTAVVKGSPPLSSIHVYSFFYIMQIFRTPTRDKKWLE